MERKSGKIINISSEVGRRGGEPMCAHYTSSKFGIIGLTQAMATELTPYNINVNAICPGVVHTDMWDKVILPYYAKEWGMSTKDAWEQWIQKIPVQRPQTAEDIGNAVVFLASEESRNITGDAMAITGGYLMH